MPQASFNIYSRISKERKYEYSKKNSYYLGGLVFFLVVLSTIIYSWWAVLNWMKSNNQPSISKLIIAGEYYYTDDNSIREAILSLGMPYSTFMTVDINKVQNKIKTMSWIKRVIVRKQWPDKLNIYLIEYKPYAKWNDAFFIDEECSVFSLPKSVNFKNDFLMLYGPQGTQNEVLKMYHTMKQQLIPYNFNIKSVSMTARRAWQLILDNNIRLNIGRIYIKERLNRFIKLYPLLKQTNKNIRYIDLRYVSGAAVG